MSCAKCNDTQSRILNEHLLQDDIPNWMVHGLKEKSPKQGVGFKDVLDKGRAKKVNNICLWALFELRVRLSQHVYWNFAKCRLDVAALAVLAF